MAPKERSSKGYVVESGTGQFYLPLEAGLAWPKHSHVLEDMRSLHQLCNSTDAELWADFCHPDFLMRAEAKEGVFVFTTFDMGDAAPDQKKILHQVPNSCLLQALTISKNKLKADGKGPAEGNERQIARWITLDWKPSDCTAPVINYGRNDWEQVEEEDKIKHALHDYVADEDDDEEQASGQQQASTGRDKSGSNGSARGALTVKTEPIKPGIQLVLPHSKAQYEVPKENICHEATHVNVVTEAELAALFSTKSPDKWIPVTAPETIWMLAGKEGKTVYTTFTIKGSNWPEEHRVLRLLSKDIATKAFAYHKTVMETLNGNDPAWACPDVLDWTADDCSTAQIDPGPKKNEWDKLPVQFKTFKETLTKGSAKAQAPAASGSKRPAGSATPAGNKKAKPVPSNGHADQDEDTDWVDGVFTVDVEPMAEDHPIEWIKTIQAGSSYSISEHKESGTITVIKYRSA